jgi:hypothetical protein
MPFRGTGHPLVVTGAHASSGGSFIAAVIIVSVLLVVLAIIIAAFLWLACGRPSLRPDRTRRRYRRDMRHAWDGGTCACCGGVSTRLRKDGPQWVCKDRRLCRETMIHENLLDQV